jgi:protein-S-isoprenylcysteine O-methyltransferase Ste14
MGAAVFALALAYFLFTYVVTFGEIAGGRPTWPPVVWNGALFTVFALHHSVFARARVRAAVARTVPPMLERSFYVWVASLLLIVVCAAWRRLPGVAWQLSGAAAWPLYALQLWGVWLSLRSAAVIDIWDLAGVRQVRAAVPTGAHEAGSEESVAAALESGEFKTNGPYGWVRHPIYSGWFLIVFAATPMTGTRLTFALISCAYVLIAIPFEERSLVATSRGAYEAYAAKVRWKLLPGLY